MTIATGTLLVLTTWFAALLILVSVGLLPVLAIVKSSSKLLVLRLSAWWGLILIGIFCLLMSLFAPLSSAQVAAIGLLVGGGLGFLGWILYRQRDWTRMTFRFRGLVPVLVIAAFVVTVYFAVAALGPVTNYDTGLYHLGAIRYTSEHSAIPGLANLYFPFGYGTAHFPLAALLTNGPWSLEGYRLLNGLVMAVAALDLVLRLLSKRHGPGLFVLASGLVATWVPMVALSDFWVTSPSQDSAALVLTVVASAYVADAVQGRGEWLAAASTAIVVGTTVTLIRPTAGAYLIGCMLVFAALLWRRRPASKNVAAPVFLSLGIGLAALVVTTARDRILSGWVQYPLSVWSFDVPWRAVDPTPFRAATLGYHRNPEDLWNSIDGWDWVGPWFVDRVQQWETYEFLALAVAAAILLSIADRRSEESRLLARALLSTAPSLVATVTWWVATPPSYRFAWGALFTLATVPLGWALWSLSMTSIKDPAAKHLRVDHLVILMTLPVFVVTAYSSVFRLDWGAIDEPGSFNVGFEIPVSFSPVVDVPVSEMTLESGLTVLRPTDSDQCWTNYPLCTPSPDSALSAIDGQWPKGLIIE